MAVACGIDFGTSNTAVTLWEDGVVRAVPVDPGARISDTIPTLLYFPPAGAPSFGTQAISEYLASDMVGRLLQAIKRYLPSDTFTGTVLGGRTRTIEELVSGFLLICREALERQAGQPVRRVLLGRPAVFHEDPRRDALAETRLRKGAALAGFEEIEVQLEPIAAARSFERAMDRDALCLIGDLGGGTSDFTVIRLGPGRMGLRDRAADVLGSSGVSIAGNDVDARLIQIKVLPRFGYGSRWRPLKQWVPLPTHLHIAATRWHKLALEASDPANLRWLDQALRSTDDAPGLKAFREFLHRNYGYLLFQVIEQAKVALSRGEETTIAFHEGGVDLDEHVTRAELEAAIGWELQKLGQCMDDLLRRLALGPDDIGAVFLTGGTSQIPSVRDLFEARFPGRILEPDAFTAVGQGLGVEAGERFGLISG